MQEMSAPPAPPSKASLYSRFIPREELSSFEAWAPGAISPSGAGAASGHVQGSAPASMRPQGDHAEQLRAARQAGYQDGYRDGLVALEGFKQSYALQVTSQVGALLQSLGSQLEALQHDMAAALADSAASLAEQIVRSELAARPELVSNVARQALDALMLSARHITLHLHPDDQPLVAQGAADVLAARGARLVADPAMARGGCRVESDIGSVDASIAARWRGSVAALGVTRPWQDEAAALMEQGAAAPESPLEQTTARAAPAGDSPPGNTAPPDPAPP